MGSPAKDIADLMVNAASLTGLTAFGTDVFVGVQPISPLVCVTIYDTGGYDADERAGIYRPTVQIRVRARTYTEGFDVTTTLRDFLHGLFEQTINSSRYLGIWAQGDVLYVGQDDKKNHEFTSNYRLLRTAE